MTRRLFLLSLLATSLATTLCFAAYTKQAARVMRVQTTPTFEAAGAVTAVQMDAFIQNRRIVDNSDPTDVTEGPWRQVTFNLLAPSIKDTTITAGGKTVSYGELAALLRKAALDRAQAQGVQ